MNDHYYLYLLALDRIRDLRREAESYALAAAATEPQFGRRPRPRAAALLRRLTGRRRPTALSSQKC